MSFVEAYLRGLWVLVSFSLILLVIVGPCLLAEYTSKPWYLLIYLVYAPLIIGLSYDT